MLAIEWLRILPRTLMIGKQAKILTMAATKPAGNAMKEAQHDLATAASRREVISAGLAIAGTLGFAATSSSSSSAGIVFGG